MYERDKRSWLKHLDFIVLDLLAIALSFAVAFSIRMVHRNFFNSPIYRTVFLTLLGFHILIAFFFRCYSEIVRRGYLDEFAMILRQNVLLLGCLLVYLVFTKQSEAYSRLFWVYFFLINIVLMTLFRFLRKAAIRRSFEEKDRREMLVFTSRLQAEACVRGLTNTSFQPFHVAGLVLTDAPAGEGEEIGGIPVVSDADHYMDYVRLHVVDEALLQMDASSDGMQETARKLLEMGIVVHFGLEPSLRAFPNKQVQRLGSFTVITSSFRTAGTAELFLKRAMDIVGSLVGLVFTGIAFLFVAPAIHHRSPGPIFFSQYRIGKNGRHFKIYKFRSMYLDAEERKKDLMEDNKMQGQMFKMDDDPRIISGIGKFIRDTSIDELPQFWNILKGDMSLVGTRPPTVDEFEHYDPHHKIRLSFRPGLTGLWQVSGRSDITDFEEVVRLDEEYIANWSLWLDIRILLKTVEVVLTRKGSE